MQRDDDEAPLCECGCGLPVRDRQRGVWARWRPGHAYRHSQRPGAVVAPTDPAPGRPHEIQLSFWPELAPPYEL